MIEWVLEGRPLIINIVNKTNQNEGKSREEKAEFVEDSSPGQPASPQWSVCEAILREQAHFDSHFL